MYTTSHNYHTQIGYFIAGQQATYLTGSALPPPDAWLYIIVITSVYSYMLLQCLTAVILMVTIVYYKSFEVEKFCSFVDWLVTTKLYQENSLCNRLCPYKSNCNFFQQITVYYYYHETFHLKQLAIYRRQCNSFLKITYY